MKQFFKHLGVLVKTHKVGGTLLILLVVASLVFTGIAVYNRCQHGAWFCTPAVTHDVVDEKLPAGHTRSVVLDVAPATPDAPADKTAEKALAATDPFDYPKRSDEDKVKTLADRCAGDDSIGDVKGKGKRLEVRLYLNGHKFKPLITWCDRVLYEIKNPPSDLPEDPLISISKDRRSLAVNVNEILRLRKCGGLKTLDNSEKGDVKLDFSNDIITAVDEYRAATDGRRLAYGRIQIKECGKAMANSDVECYFEIPSIQDEIDMARCATTTKPSK